MTVERTMAAWQVTALGEPAEVMTRATLPVPEPGPGQVLVEVWSAALDLCDVLLARGEYQERPALPFTPGLELCGMIVGVGLGVPAHLVGERVIGTTTLPNGALARYAVAAEGDVHPAPPGLDDPSASAMHTAYQTAWFGLYRRAALRVGETLLVHAPAGGVGSAAVQLGRAAGAKVIGLVAGADQTPTARGLGCDTVIDRSSQDVVAALRQATGGRGVDVVFDPDGGAGYAACTDAIAFEGRIVVVCAPGGQPAAPALDGVLVDNHSIVGLNWERYRAEHPELVRRAHDDLCRLVGAGAVRPLVSQRLPFDAAAQGLGHLAAGETSGRLTVSPTAGR